MSEPTKQPSLKQMVAKVSEQLAPSADYNATKTSRFRRARAGLPAVGASEDWHWRNEESYFRANEYFRDMARNDGIIETLIDRVVDNTIKGGFTCQPATSSDELNARLFDHYEIWSKDCRKCDHDREHNLNGMESIAFADQLLVGDIGGLLTDKWAIQMFENHTIRTPSRRRSDAALAKADIHLGVEMDGRKRVAYYVAKDAGAFKQLAPTLDKMTRIPAADKDGRFQFVHLYRPTRFSQRRGVSAFAPILDLCSMFDDLNLSTLVKAKLNAFLGIIEQLEAKPNDFGSDAIEGDQSNAPDAGLNMQKVAGSDTEIATIEGIGMGAWIRSKNKLSAWTANVPNPEFFQHLHLTLELIGIHLGLPLQMVLLSGKQTNFSGWRGAMDQAKRHFEKNQQRHRERWYDRIWPWFVDHVALNDKKVARLLKREPKKYACNWAPPNWPFIQPLDDARAQVLKQRNLLTSPRRNAATNGEDIDVIVDESISDNSRAIIAAKQRAAAINQQFPNDPPVSWMQVLTLPTQDQITASMNLDTQPQPQQGDNQQ